MMDALLVRMLNAYLGNILLVTILDTRLLLMMNAFRAETMNALRTKTMDAVLRRPANPIQVDVVDSSLAHIADPGPIVVAQESHPLARTILVEAVASTTGARSVAWRGG